MSTVEGAGVDGRSGAGAAAGPIEKSIAGVGRNAAILTGATLACKAGSLVVMPFILRAFSRADYGTYSAAFAYAWLLGMVTYFGMGPIVVRDIARGEQPRGAVVFHCVIMRMALLAAAGLALVALGCWKHFNPLMWALTWLAFAAMGLDAVTGAVKSSMQAEGRFDLMAGVDVVRRASQWALALFVILVGSGVAGLAGAVVIAAVGAAAAALYFGTSRDDFRGLRFIPSYALNMFRLSAPMGISAAFVLALERVDIWVIDAYRGSSEVGVYAAGMAFKPAFLAQAVVWAVLPLAFRLGKEDRDGLARTVRTGGRYLLMTGVAIALVYFCGGAVLMPLLGGSQYTDSVFVFRVMGLTIPFVYVSFLYLHALTAVDRQLTAMLAFAAGLGVNVALDVLLVPSMGAAGAIIGTLSAEALMAGIALLAVWKLVGAPVGAKDARVVAAALGGAGAAAVTTAAGVVDLGAIALAVFCALLIALKAFTRDDVELVKRSFSRRNG